jgi:hypothetical protein
MADFIMPLFSVGLQQPNFSNLQGRKITALVVNCSTEKFDLAAPNHSYLNSRRFS